MIDLLAITVDIVNLYLSLGDVEVRYSTGCLSLKRQCKIHNCYDSLISGFIDDGLTNMTRLAQDKIYYREENNFGINNIENVKLRNIF